MKELRWLKLHYIRISESAKIRNREADAFSEKSEEDRLGRVSEKSQTSSEKGIVDFNGSKVAGDKWSVENANVIRRNKNEIVNSIGREQEVDSNLDILEAGWETGNRDGAVSEFRELLSKNQTDLDGSGRIHLEQDRAELLRKLDELKEQLSRSCDVVDKLKEKVTLDGRVVPPEAYGGGASWFPNGSSGSRKPSMPFYGPDKRAAEAGPSYFIYFPEPFACPVEQDMTRHGMYPTMHNLNHVPAYGDPFGSKMLGRALHQFPGKYQQHLIQTFLDIPAPIPPGSFGNKRFHDVPGNPLYHIDNPESFGSRFHMPPMNVNGTQAHGRWPSDINSEMNGFFHLRPQRVVSANRFGRGNRSSRSDQEKVMSNKGTTRQNSLKEALHTEMEVSFNEYFNTGISQDSWDATRESNDSVHGHHIPEGVVKKAEKMAGTFLPGQYCGTTGVYVNGRELDQKDLDLLASSGLPTDRNRSYVVEISDRVLDEDTGEELESVGKLAPTAEKAKRRFGMKAPRAAA
ncbi:Detected protein of unknown function [Hibiscus syriacus]|uniref:Uncharacterized protein n=1 Tax=Hibiscus syriacus TaxID=106335 RepID=A0A6A3CXP2_HIBSY|nr:Detected protein of unknown function [Hibiscus syriacus]